MKKIRCFFIWQDEEEEAWLRGLASQGLRLDAVKFPFTYFFSEHSGEKYSYHLNTPKDAGLSLAAFEKPFKDAGWERVGRMNGWHYFRKAYLEDDIPVIAWGGETKAARYQQLMMVLVGVLPFLLFIFPAIGKRIPHPAYDVLRIIYFLFLALYTLTTLKVYRRVMRLRGE